ncbi:hypothetical protein [Streptomyces misionensis]|uniref:hypothetical protein n=1 Tax=Streptomyces misionensis TaxID=67331 RepID=UPI003682455B
MRQQVHLRAVDALLRARPARPGAACDANGAAQTPSRIEQQRLHADLTPHFRRTVVADEA